MNLKHFYIVMVFFALAIGLAVLLRDAPRLFAEPGEPPYQASRKYRFYIGLDGKEANAGPIPVDEAKSRLNAAAMKHASGFTVWEAQGFWRDEQGREFSEDTLVYDFLDLSEPAMAALAEEMRAAMNQEAILVERTDASVMFFMPPARTR